MRSFGIPHRLECVLEVVLYQACGELVDELGGRAEANRDPLLSGGAPQRDR